jgi:RNA polymerase sigma-70 factor, ECF subfamily
VDLFSFDDGYVRRLREGDAATMDHFVAYFTQLLRIKLRYRRLSPDRVEDITQETFARVFKALQMDNGIRHPERIGAYVNSVCNFVIQERSRDDFKNQTPEESQIDPPDEIIVDIEGRAIRAEIMAHIRGVIKTLPERERGVIRMIFFEEKEKDEVCRLLDVDRDYLRVLLHRAIEHLRKKL